MEKRQRRKRVMLLCGAVALASAAVIAGISLSGDIFQAAEHASGTSFLRETTPLSTVSVKDTADGSAADIQINGTKIRRTENIWEYSTDNGKTWTDTPPDGVRMGNNGDLSMWQGQREPEDFDYGAFMKDIDKLLNDIRTEANECYASMLPQGGEGGASLTFGDSIARQVDGVWEFSSDGGETWTKDAPEGFEVSDDGTRFRLGGGDGDVNDMDVDAWLDEWYKEWSSNYDGTDYKGTNVSPNIAV